MFRRSRMVIKLQNMAGESFSISYKNRDQEFLEKVQKYKTQDNQSVNGKLLKNIFSMVDLTTLDSSDSLEKIRLITSMAKHEKLGTVACVCVYPYYIPLVKKFKDADFNICSVGGCFPSSLVPLEVKLAEIDWLLRQEVHEIDIVLNKGAYFSQNYEEVYNEMATISKRCRQKNVLLKVILETGELSTYADVWICSMLAMHAGCDFIKTSTGKCSEGATLEKTLVMAHAIKEYQVTNKRKVGLKVSGGVKTVQDALSYQRVVASILGDKWNHKKYFRIGASSLLKDLEDSLKLVDDV